MPGEGVGVRSGRFRAAGALLILASIVALGACAGSDGEGVSIPRAGDDATATATPAPNPPAGWERFDDGDFGGYVPANSEVVYLPAGDLQDTGVLLDGLDEDARQIIEAAMANLAETDLFFIFLGSEVQAGGNVNLAACEMNGQAIPGEGQIRLGYRLLGVEFDEVGEVTHGGAPAIVFRTRLAEMFETYQVVLKGPECSLLVTLTLLPGDYEGFATNFKEFIRLLEFRGGPAIE